MGTYPTQGESPWDAELKSYIDDADAAIADTIPDLIADAAEVQMAGLELGYAESTADFTTTDAVSLTTRITGMIVPVLGTGRPVSIKFVCPDSWHSVAGTRVILYLVVDDVALTTEGQIIGVRSSVNTDGPEAILERRLVIADGVTKTFKVGMLLGAAGTGHAKGDPSAPMYLTAVSQ